ncbi:MAG: glycine dehydrogenase (aminomethyl-transferring), partial [Actinobacteria bacterium]|nr:glycine dehydrogenase (aminomethyl-transferring) [Actinomycetota bacterium]
MAFEARHIGPDHADRSVMLKSLGYSDLETFIKAVVPAGIADSGSMGVPAAVGESQALAELQSRMAAMELPTSMIGLGYHGTVIPEVIKRGILLNPGWYTAYTPYQPEISQGRLEALLNFQTLVEDLTGLAVAGASLLDEATAVAEAVAIAVKHGPRGVQRVAIDEGLHPQVRAVVQTRAEPVGVEIVEFDPAQGLVEGELSGVVLAYPASAGQIVDPRAVLSEAKDRGALVVMDADPLALTLLRSPGALGADIAVGSMQRYGVPMAFGGPHAGYIAVRSGLERSLPGRLVGVSVDADGRPAYRLALQTREQHIRREKATSNICTAQVLLAVLASMYAVYHGPEGLRGIARRLNHLAERFRSGARDGGLSPQEGLIFDTVALHVPGAAQTFADTASTAGINVRVVDADTVSVTVDETTTEDQARALAEAWGFELVDVAEGERPGELTREDELLPYPVFHQYRSETSLMRYMRSLADKDLALDRTMIPLGS